MTRASNASARVARSYGANVTDAAVRNNPLTKVYLCHPRLRQPVEIIVSALAVCALPPLRTTLIQSFRIGA
jgi:hypothetical protein